MYCIDLRADRVIRGRRYYDRRPLFARLSSELAAKPAFDGGAPLVIDANVADAEALAKHCASRAAERAKSFGIEFEFVSPAEAGRIAPILRTDDLAGAVWIPGDGKANPTDLTQSLARGARMGGASIVEGAKVTGVRTGRGRVRSVDLVHDGAQV